MFTTEDIINRFKADHSVRLEKNTLADYIVSVRQMLSFCAKPYQEITTRDIRNWLIHLEENRHKLSSINKYLFGLRLFYQYCLEEELMNSNPAKGVPLPKGKDKLPRYLTTEQLTKLRLLVGEGNLKQRAVIEVLYTTGVRIGELSSMKLEDIHWEERKIHIPRGKGKKERIVLFTKECSEHVRAYLQERTDEVPYLFLNEDGTGAVCKGTIRNWFISYREKLGCYLSPHILRHTFATHLAMKGMPIACLQVLLGHQHASQTLQYARLYQQAQKDKYDEWM